MDDAVLAMAWRLQREALQALWAQLQLLRLPLQGGGALPRRLMLSPAALPPFQQALRLVARGQAVPLAQLLPLLRGMHHVRARRLLRSRFSPSAFVG